MATPPDFSVGQVLTASQMNAVGLWLVKTVTVGSGVSSVDVTSAFSSDFDIYLVSYADVDCSVNNGGLFFRFGTNASPVTTNYKFAGRLTGYTGVPLDVQQSSPGYWEVGGTNTDKASGTFTVNAPNLAAHSTFTGMWARTGGAFSFAGIHEATTQHTGFYLYPSSGTLTGGTIRVYGYRN